MGGTYKILVIDLTYAFFAHRALWRSGRRHGRRRWLRGRFLARGRRRGRPRAARRKPPRSSRFPWRPLLAPIGFL